MQIPHQPPEDEQRQASQPLYEFSTESGPLPVPPPEEKAGGEPSQVSPTPQGAWGALPGEPPSAEAVRQGLIYPPPPSFYQNMELPTRQVPLPPPTASGGPFVPQTMDFAPPGYKEGAPPFLLPPPVVPQAKSSRKWVWILVSMLVGVFVLSCGLCSWAGYTLIAPSVQDATNAMGLVSNYYEAIQAKNYTTAYQYLSPTNGLTQEEFVQQAQERDKQYGPVLSYVPNQANVQAGSQPDLTHLTVVVNVSRSHLKYPVLLSLQKIGNNWKIVDYDKI